MPSYSALTIHIITSLDIIIGNSLFALYLPKPRQNRFTESEGNINKINDLTGYSHRIMGILILIKLKFK